METRKKVQDDYINITAKYSLPQSDSRIKEYYLHKTKYKDNVDVTTIINKPDIQVKNFSDETGNYIIKFYS